MIRLSPIASLLYAAGYGPAQLAAAFAQPRHYIFYNVPLTVASEFPTHSRVARYSLPPATPHVNYSLRHLPRGPSRPEYRKGRGSNSKKSSSKSPNSSFKVSFFRDYWRNTNLTVTTPEGSFNIPYHRKKELKDGRTIRTAMRSKGIQNAGLVKLVEKFAAKL